MPHLVLLGDSVMDNGSYTEGGPAVVTQVQQQLPAGWRASLGAIDGSTTDDIADQLSTLPADATHLVLSVGGNDALLRADVLDTPVASSGDALLVLADAARAFEASYRNVVDACLSTGIPLVVCTVYKGDFPEPDFRQRVAVALTAFNDAIIRIAVEKQLTVIDLRFLCNSSADFANPIEPSCRGGAKIAAAVTRAVTEPAQSCRGAQVLGS